MGPHADNGGVELPLSALEAEGFESGASALPRDPPEMFDELASKGLQLLESKGDLLDACRLLERALAIHTDDAEVAYGLGVAYGLLALRALSTAPASLLDSSAAAEALAARAILCYQRAVDLDPGNAQPWNNLATLYALRGDRELAVEALKRSLQAEPGQPNVRERLEELGEF